MTLNSNRSNDSRASPAIRVVDGLVDALADAGVRHVFGVSGANIEDLFATLNRSVRDISGVIAKHEFSAATMADGWSRVTGGLGVVAATSGGGAMNLVPALAEAHASRVPVLALVGEAPAALAGTGAFQDMSGQAGTFDAQRVFEPISRFCARAEDPATVLALLDRAITAALAPVHGPAVLLLPKDVQLSSVRWRAQTGAVPRDHCRPDDRRRAVEVLTRDASGDIVLIAGHGAATARARQGLSRLAELLDAAVAVEPDAKYTFDNRDPHFVGVIGVMGHPGAEAAVRRAAAVVLVGTRLPAMARFGLGDLTGTPVVCLGPEPPFVPAGAHLSGEVGDELDALCALLPARGRNVTALPHPPRLRSLPAHTGPGLGYREAVQAIEEALPDGATVVVDAGNTGAAAIHQLRAPQDGHLLVALGMGGMGYSFGAGIGAALATGQRSYVIAGDGAFFMHGMEIHTAVQYALPVTFIVFDNSAHAMCVLRETLYTGGATRDNRFGPSYLASGIAAMFPTVPARHVDTADALLDALALTSATSGPVFISVACDADEIPPFAPFLPNSEEPGHDRP